MDKLGIFRSAGVAVGIVVGLILCVILFKVANTNNKTKTEYDERQKLVRGKAYMYAFYTLVAFEVIMMCVSMSGVLIPVADYVLHMAGLLISIIVMCGYCIWKDVYWGLNNDPKKYAVIFVVALLINILAAAMGIAGGNLMENGQIGFPMINLMVAVMMVIVLIEMLIKRIVDNGRSREED